jgi:ribonuclease D
MSKGDLPLPILIEAQSDFDNLAESLRAVPRLAVDTESNSLHAYPERVCLIQLSTEADDFLLDPLALDSLHALGAVLSDAAIEKVFHAAEYDLICLYRDFGFQIAGLFDTRVACRTLGYPRTGLSDVLGQHFQVELDKRYQRANWGRRPLSPALLDYARLDTHFLLPLRDRLAKELEDAGRTAEAREECEWLARQALVETPPSEGFWRIGRARQLPPDRAAVLRELYEWRDGEARRLNRPPFKILSDKALLALTEALPGDRRALGRVSDVPQRQRHRYADALLEAVSRGRRAPRPARPAGRSSDEAALARYQTLRQWRKHRAEARHVESDVILPRETLWEIARLAPADEQTLARLMTPLRWRFQQYGKDILEVLSLSPNGSRP